MKSEDVRARLTDLRVYKSNGRRAAHKPLLVLRMLADLAQGREPDYSLDELARVLDPLLGEFGPPNPTDAIYPFWHLRNDQDIWRLRDSSNRVIGQGEGEATRRWLREHGVRGSLDPRIQEHLQRHPEVLRTVARDLLAEHFPESIHEDIASELGLDLGSEIDRESEDQLRRRDPNFRRNVLQTYQSRCAVCRFDLIMGNHSVGLEAAHIQWFSHRGPDVESNGLALCTLHHKLFDLGVYTVDAEHRVRVSAQVRGYGGAGALLLDHHGREIHRPLEKDHLPDPRYLAWHEREVFRRPARPAA